MANKLKYENEINKYKSNLESNYILAKEIALGNYKSASENKTDDDFAKILIEMSSNLLKADSEEKKRTWSLAGHTHLAEIIRQSSNNMSLLSNEIVSYLVKYLKANQGGLYVVHERNNTSKFIKLEACYAYDRKKFVNKEFEINEGLVGQVIFEKETVFMTDIPEGYFEITSGLGQASPRSLLLVPLKLEQNIVGVVEIASFHVFDTHEIEFLEKASESIASILITTQTAQVTEHLLKESQNLAEQLQQQEEEMRQSMEEMQATQEEMRRKELEINRLFIDSKNNEKLLQEKMKENEELERNSKIQTQKLLDEIENNRKIISLVINKLPQKIFLKNSEGRFMLLNESVAKDLNRSVEELIGKNDYDLFSFEEADGFWKVEKEQVLDKKQKIEAYESFTINGQLKHFYTVKMPFYFPNSDEIGILGYQADITEIKKLEGKVKDHENVLTAKEKAFEEMLKERDEIIRTLRMAS
ncbi:MAG: GAF domain-containing protein [Cytophagales bacterium]